MTTEERELKKGSGCGLAIVIALALIFFALLVLLIGESRRDSAVPPPKTPTELFVTPARMRVRVQPSAKAPVIDYATRGERLKVIEVRGSWAKVETPRKLTGWAERNALERAEARKRRLERLASIRKLPALPGVVLEKTALYSGPGLFFPVAGQLQPDVRVQIFTRDHDFYAIESEGEIAYVSIDAVDISSSGDEKLEVAARDERDETVDTAGTAPDLPTEAPPAEPAPAPAAEAAVASSSVYPAVPSGGTEPRVVSRVMPTYPSAARRYGVEGRVILRGIVRSNGTIDDVEIVKDLPYGLGEAARKAVQRWRFAPALHNGREIDVYYTVTVNYRLSE